MGQMNSKKDLLVESPDHQKLEEYLRPKTGDQYRWFEIKPVKDHRHLRLFRHLFISCSQDTEKLRFSIGQWENGWFAPVTTISMSKHWVTNTPELLLSDHY